MAQQRHFSRRDEMRIPNAPAHNLPVLTGVERRDRERFGVSIREEFAETTRAPLRIRRDVHHSLGAADTTGRRPRVKPKKKFLAVTLPRRQATRRRMRVCDF
jgi:hypothetical protein